MKQLRKRLRMIRHKILHNKNGTKIHIVAQTSILWSILDMEKHTLLKPQMKSQFQILSINHLPSLTVLISMTSSLLTKPTGGMVEPESHQIQMLKWQMKPQKNKKKNKLKLERKQMLLKNLLNKDGIQISTRVQILILWSIPDME